MATTLLVAALMILGVVGIVVPALPGLAIIWASTALWAWDRGLPGAWWIFAIATIWYAAGLVLQYLIPGKRMKSAGVRTSTLVLAVLCAIVGFFVIPVIGSIVGFVGGIFAVEFARARAMDQAWTSTKHALTAVGVSMGIELAAAFLIITTWVAGLAILGMR